MCKEKLMSMRKRGMKRSNKITRGLNLPIEIVLFFITNNIPPNKANIIHIKNELG